MTPRALVLLALAAAFAGLLSCGGSGPDDMKTTQEPVDRAQALQASTPSR